MFFFFFNDRAELSRAQPWQELAFKLSKEVAENASKPGFKAGDFIVEVAKMRQENPRNIGLLLQAWKFLERVYTEKANPAEVQCGFTHLIELAKIQDLDAEQADRLLDTVLKNKMTHIELKAVHSKLKSEFQSSKPSAIKSAVITQHHAFLSTLEEALNQAGSDFWLSEGASSANLYRNCSIGPLQVDFMWEYEDGRCIVFEAKSYLPTATQSQRINSLGRYALLSRFVSEYWFIAPETYVSGLQELEPLATQLSLKCHFALLEKSMKDGQYLFRDTAQNLIELLL